MTVAAVAGKVMTTPINKGQVLGDDLRAIHLVWRRAGREGLFMPLVFTVFRLVQWAAPGHWYRALFPSRSEILRGDPAASLNPVVSDVLAIARLAIIGMVAPFAVPGDIGFILSVWVLAIAVAQTVNAALLDPLRAELIGKSWAPRSPQRGIL